MSTVDFPTWFSAGCYGGLACCMFAIAANALYTTLRKRGTTRQLASVIMLCVFSALLLLPAVVWYNVRFTSQQAALSFAEIEVALAYVALWGWLLPLGATAVYCLFTLPRNSATAVRIPLPAVVAGAKPSSLQLPPRHQPGVLPPYVYGEDTPWGWLEYRSGNFQGQRLALKRAVVTIGRDEDNDIWLDDEMASRHHAELAWHQGKIYLTDCESLNGVLLNERRVRGSSPVNTNDLLEVGSHRFTFILAERREDQVGESDPLAHHKWRSAAQEPMTSNDDLLPATKPLGHNPVSGDPILFPALSQKTDAESLDSKETAQVNQAAPLHLPIDCSGALIIRTGEMTGQGFLLDRPVVTVGRGIESDIVINDASISRRHLQFLRQADGDYVQELASRNGTKVNGEPLMTPRLLKSGDSVLMGNILLEYTSAQAAQTTPLTFVITPAPPFTGPISGVGFAPLKLPSKQKQQS